MKLSRTLIVTLLFSGTLLVLAVLATRPFSTIYELCGGDIEFSLLLVDAESGAPVPGATVVLRVRARDDQALRDTFRLVTDASGRARFLLKKQTYETVHRPFRKNYHIALWALSGNYCDFDAEAQAYRPLHSAWLSDFNYADEGWSDQEQLVRFEYTIPLQKEKE
jgi:hypothetical protein